jgi:hypothetical protein
MSRCPLSLSPVVSRSRVSQPRRVPIVAESVNFDAEQPFAKNQRDLAQRSSEKTVFAPEVAGKQHPRCIAVMKYQAPKVLAKRFGR